jgi:sulfur relay (sulfurtransferase) complex TusBCD TusD component (DsrE family)
MKLGIMVRTGPYSNQNIDTALRLLNAALDAGHRGALFLFEDGVLNASNGIRPTGDRNIGELVRALAGRGADVAICGQCGNYRGIHKDGLVDGVKRAGMGQLGQMVATCDRFFSLGP